MDHEELDSEYIQRIQAVRLSELEAENAALKEQLAENSRTATEDFYRIRELKEQLAAAQKDAELWRHAIQNGIVTVHSERVHERDPGTLCSWIQGHSKAADISNDYAAIEKGKIE